MAGTQRGRESRRLRRETARQLAKELMRNQPARRKREWDVGWFLATFLALALLLIAPKLGRSVTVVTLIAMIACLAHPVSKLGFVQAASTLLLRYVRFGACMLAGVALVIAFGAYVWPPIKRHTLSPREQTAFIDSLKSSHGGDPISQVQLFCPGGDETPCVFAQQFISLFGRAGWPIQPSVNRLTLGRARDGITVFRRAGDKEHMMTHWDSGGWVAINEAHLLAVHAAFQTIHIFVDSGAYPDLPENVMGIYFGPEKDESKPTHLTRSIEWVNGDRHGPFPTE